MDGHDRLLKQGYLRCEAPGIGCEWVNSLNGKEYPSTIATYGFMAVKSLWPVHFIITSAGIPRRREFTTKVRRAQCVAMSGYTQYTMFFY